MSCVLNGVDRDGGSESSSLAGPSGIPSPPGGHPGLRKVLVRSKLFKNNLYLLNYSKLEVAGSSVVCMIHFG